MKFQHDDSWANLEATINLRLPIRDAWSKIIDFYEKTVPRSYWNLLRQLEIEKEQINIKEWLEQLVIQSPLPDNVVALWIGITKFLDDDKETSVIYLIGADTYNKKNVDWATEPSYDPVNKYGVLNVLNQIDAIIKEEDAEAYSFLDWILPLAYCSLSIDDIIRSKMDKTIFLKSQANIFVTVGHDSGDYIALSSIE